MDARLAIIHKVWDLDTRIYVDHMSDTWRKEIQKIRKNFLPPSAYVITDRNKGE